MSPTIIFVEGNIGSGKTTFLSLLEKKYPNCQVIYEPLEKWTELSDSQGKNILQYFYDDMNRYTYTFQSFAFLSRAMLLDKIDQKVDIVFIERSIFSDKNIFAKNCYQNGSMSEIEWNLYNKWFEWMISKLKLDNYMHLYLKCNPEISYERLRKRNRKEEENISLKYIKDIYECHENWLNNEKTIMLDASQPFVSDEETLRNMISKISMETFNFDAQNIIEIMHC